MRNSSSVDKKALDILKRDRTLEVKVLDLLYKQFNFRMQSKVRQLKQMHIFRKIRKDIARAMVRLSK